MTDIQHPHELLDFLHQQQWEKETHQLISYRKGTYCLTIDTNEVKESSFSLYSSSGLHTFVEQLTYAHGTVRARILARMKKVDEAYLASPLNHVHAPVEAKSFAEWVHDQNIPYDDVEKAYHVSASNGLLLSFYPLENQTIELIVTSNVENRSFSPFTMSVNEKDTSALFEKVSVFENMVPFLDTWVSAPFKDDPLYEEVLIGKEQRNDSLPKHKRVMQRMAEVFPSSWLDYLFQPFCIELRTRNQVWVDFMKSPQSPECNQRLENMLIELMARYSFFKHERDVFQLSTYRIEVDGVDVETLDVFLHEWYSKTKTILEDLFPSTKID